MHTRKSIAEIIAERDEIDFDDALRVVDDAISICRNLLISGESPSDVEDAWMEETGLEVDYMIDVVC